MRPSWRRCKCWQVLFDSSRHLDKIQLVNETDNNMKFLNWARKTIIMNPGSQEKSSWFPGLLILFFHDFAGVFMTATDAGSIGCWRIQD
jgi:hypothetical protein